MRTNLYFLSLITFILFLTTSRCHTQCSQFSHNSIPVSYQYLSDNSHKITATVSTPNAICYSSALCRVWRLYKNNTFQSTVINTSNTHTFDINKPGIYKIDVSYFTKSPSNGCNMVYIDTTGSINIRPVNNYYGQK